MGVTYSSFHYRINTNPNEGDAVKLVSITGGPGFAIQVPMISWNPAYSFNLRFHPSLSFHETLFDYTYERNGGLDNKTFRWEATNVNFPIQFKLNSKRMNNFGAYSMGGLMYSRNLINQEKVEQNLSSPILKTKPNDFSFNVGGGFDFFLPYFKFGIEIKMISGITDILIQDNTFFSSPLQSLRSQSWWISLTFEG